jgi:peptidoglycan/LPS O-acetylase OafA/YrhL
MPSPKSGLVPNLDFVRACAVLLVLFDHTFLKLGITSVGRVDMNWIGRTGVLFFFVHTCCVLMMSLERHKGERFFADFYLRRAFRIYPLSITAVLLAMIPPHRPVLTHMEWFSNLALIQNLTFSKDALEPLWTLPLEVQMYLFLPFVFLLARRSRTLWPLLGLFALSIPIAVLVPLHIARANVFAFAPAFLPGVIAYWLFRHRKPGLPAWGLGVAIACITLVFVHHANWNYSAWLCCLALGCVVPFFRQIETPWINAPAFYTAKYSYGIYLSHALLLVWMQPTWKTVPLYLAAVAAGSVACYHLIEHPMVRLSQRLTARPNSKATDVASHSPA